MSLYAIVYVKQATVSISNHTLTPIISQRLQNPTAVFNIRVFHELCSLSVLVSVIVDWYPLFDGVLADNLNDLEPATARCLDVDCGHTLNVATITPSICMQSLHVGVVLAHPPVLMIA